MVRLPPSRRPKRSEYQAFVEAVWVKLEDRTGHTAHYMGPGKLASYCPVCKSGTVTVTFLTLDTGPAFKATSGGAVGCSLGCPAKLIGEALR